MDSKFSLKGKAALVTGAGRTTGLCYGMAKALQDAGAKVVLCDLTEGVFELCEHMGGAAAGVYAVQANLCDTEHLEEAFDRPPSCSAQRFCWWT